MLPVQGTPVDVLAKALYTSDTKLQLAATSKFRKILSVFGEFSTEYWCSVLGILKADGPSVVCYLRCSCTTAIGKGRKV